MFCSSYDLADSSVEGSLATEPSSEEANPRSPRPLGGVGGLPRQARRHDENFCKNDLRCRIQKDIMTKLPKHRHTDYHEALQWTGECEA